MVILTFMIIRTLYRKELCIITVSYTIFNFLKADNCVYLVYSFTHTLDFGE